MFAMTTQKLAYSIPEAAKVASASVSVLRRKIATNDITVRYIGSKPVILADELKAWLESLPSEPAAGHTPVNQYVTPESDAAPDLSAGPDPAPEPQRPKPLFRTPEEVAPELGISKSALRQYCKTSGIHTRLGKRIVLHEDEIPRLVEWIREDQDKGDEWWTEAELDPFE